MTAGALAFWVTGLGLTLLFLRGVGGAPGRIGIAFVFAGPPVLILACLWSGTFGDFRLKVVGVEASAASLVRPFRIGGDVARDDLLFGALPAGLVSIQRSRTGRPEWKIETGGADGAAGVVEIETADGQQHLVGSHELRVGDVMCVMRCGTDRHVAYRLAPDERRLERIGGGAPLPRFSRRPLARIRGHEIWSDFAFWEPTRGIYPLRDYGLPWRAAAPDRNPCGSRFLCLPDNRSPVRSFIYYDRGLRILLLDAGARLTRGDAVIYERTAGPITLGADLPIAALRLYAVSYGDAYSNHVTASRPPSRLRWTGDLRTQAGGDQIRIALQRPHVTQIQRSEIDYAVQRGAPEAQLSLTLLGAVGPDGPSTAANPIHIRALGGALAAGIEPRLLLHPQSDHGRSGNLFSLTGSEERVRLGEPFMLGASAPGRQAQIVLERLDLPRLMLAVAPFWALLLGWGRLELWRERPWALLIVAAVQWLLAIRFLVGLESAFLNPRLALGDAVGGNIAAYVAGPLFLAAVAEPRESAQRLWPAGLFAAAVLAALFVIFGRSAGLAVSAVVATAAGALIFRSRLSQVPRRIAAIGLVLVLITLLAAAASSLGWLFAAAAVLVALGAGIGRIRHWLREKIETYPGWSAVLFLVLLLIPIRLILLFAGANERLGGWTGNISVLYLPGLLLAVAGLWTAAVKRPKPEGAGAATLSFARGLGAAWLLVAAFGVVAVVGDLGFAIYAIPAVVVGLAVTLGLQRAWSTGWTAGVAAFLLVVAVSVLPTPGAEADRARRLEAALEDVRSIEPEARAAAAARVAAILGAINEASADELRLHAALAPERLSMSGTTDAENLRRVNLILADYTATSWGRGYMHRSNPGEIRPYQADDNVSAVHIVSPFGRFGALVLLLALGALAVAGWKATAADFRGLAARVALWSIFAVATYMVLANLQLVPFTGRNIYLLAALSGSDFLEGLLLFLVALCGTKARS